jgi:manganese transport system permease protein
MVATLPTATSFTLLEMVTQSLFMQRALLAALIIGFTNGAFGAIVVLRKSALVASSLSHGLLPGVAAGILIAGLAAWNVFLGALIAALIVILSGLAVSRNSRLDQGSALAIMLTIAFAIGVLITDHLPVGKHIDLEDYLFGDIMYISSGDLWVVFGIGAITLLLVSALQRPILLTIFEANVAEAQGAPVRAINYLLMTLLVLVMVASLQAVGCILSLVILVAPAASIYLLCNSTQWMFWGGGILGAVGSAAGVLLGDRLGWRPGVAITLLLGGVFLLAFLVSSLRRPRTRVALA